VFVLDSPRRNARKFCGKKNKNPVALQNPSESPAIVAGCSIRMSLLQFAFYPKWRSIEIPVDFQIGAIRSIFMQPEFSIHDNENLEVHPAGSILASCFVRALICMKAKSNRLSAAL
jgi:hypothetical protein